MNGHCLFNFIIEFIIEHDILRSIIDIEEYDKILKFGNLVIEKIQNDNLGIICMGLIDELH